MTILARKRFFIRRTKYEALEYLLRLWYGFENISLPLGGAFARDTGHSTCRVGPLDCSHFRLNMGYPFINSLFFKFP